MEVPELFQNRRVRRVCKGLRAECSGPALDAAGRHVALDTCRKEGFLRRPSTARCGPGGGFAPVAPFVIAGFEITISDTTQTCQDLAVSGSCSPIISQDTFRERSQSTQCAVITCKTRLASGVGGSVDDVLQAAGGLLAPI
jgi:hypothetical protein